jgi:hypothetical protein
VQAGKDGTVRVIDRDTMSLVQEIFTILGHPSTGIELYDGLWGAPAYWNNTVYFWAREDSLKAFHVSNGLLSGEPTYECCVTYAYPGAIPSISANGTSSGIVWSVGTTSVTNKPVLQAFNALDLSLLYSSDQAGGGRDSLGSSAVRFSVPTVANGRVYVTG